MSSDWRVSIEEHGKYPRPSNCSAGLLAPSVSFSLEAHIPPQCINTLISPPNLISFIWIVEGFV